jgi:hypothetical protein
MMNTDGRAVEWGVFGKHAAYSKCCLWGWVGPCTYVRIGDDSSVQCGSSARGVPTRTRASARRVGKPNDLLVLERGESHHPSRIEHSRAWLVLLLPASIHTGRQLRALLASARPGWWWWPGGRWWPLIRSGYWLHTLSLLHRRSTTTAPTEVI